MEATIRVAQFYGKVLDYLEFSGQIHYPRTEEEKKEIIISFMVGGASDHLTVGDIDAFVSEVIK